VKSEITSVSKIDYKYFAGTNTSRKRQKLEVCMLNKDAEKAEDGSNMSRV
jgi:hypothetical protein